MTREILPGLAGLRVWQVHADHCFQRILLDVAVGGVWYDAVHGRPAYRHVALDVLQRAVTIGRDVAAGTTNLTALNRQSLAWRRARRLGHPR